MTKQDLDNALTSKLRYERISPSALKFVDATPTWAQPAVDYDDMFDTPLDEEWRAAHIRTELARLNIQPQGRTRRALATQLVNEFVKPERIATSLATLSDDAYKVYLHLLLTLRLETRFTTPASLDTLCPSPFPLNLPLRQILDAGLAMRSESGQLYIPPITLRSIPPCNIAFPILPEPSEFIPAKAPQAFLLQIQQTMGLFDGKTYTLRDRLRWNAPDHAFYNQVHCWPPHPDGAELLISGKVNTGKISLWPPEPQLEEQALQQWADHLNLPPDMTELLYHMLTLSAILHAGSPVRINQTLVQKWLALPPSRQIVILYHLYHSVSLWAGWWSNWRKGQLDIKWDFQGYWGLTYIDATVLSTNHNLRRVFLDVLSFLPQDAWLDFDAVIEWILKVFPNSSSHRYSRGLTITGVAGGWKGWLKLVLKSMLTGPLHYLGFTDLAPSIEHVKAFRLHHLQDVHWERVSELDIGIVGAVELNALHIDPRSQVLKVTIPVPPDFLSMIQLWSKPDGLKDKALHFHLDVERLHQAFERGNTPVDLRNAWEACAGFAVPETLDQWWDHWWRNYGHVRLYPQQAALMTADDFTMKELQLAIPSLMDSILGIVTPKTALIKSEDADQVLADLERQGYMPKDVS